MRVLVFAFTLALLSTAANAGDAANGKTVFGGTVIRLVIKIPSFGLPFIWFDATIGSGFPEALNSAALTAKLIAICFLQSCKAHRPIQRAHSRLRSTE